MECWNWTCARPAGFRGSSEMRRASWATDHSILPSFHHSILQLTINHQPFFFRPVGLMAGRPAFDRSAGVRFSYGVCVCSSTVERPAVARVVDGSNPVRHLRDGVAQRQRQPTQTRPSEGSNPSPVIVVLALRYSFSGLPWSVKTPGAPRQLFSFW